MSDTQIVDAPIYDQPQPAPSVPTKPESATPTANLTGIDNDQHVTNNNQSNNEGRAEIQPVTAKETQQQTPPNPEEIARREAETQTRRKNELNLTGANILARQINQHDVSSIPSDSEARHHFFTIGLLNFIGKTNETEFSEKLTRDGCENGIPMTGGNPLEYTRVVNGQVERYTITRLTGFDGEHFTCATDAAVSITISRAELLIAATLSEQETILKNTPPAQREALAIYLGLKDAEATGQPVMLEEGTDVANIEAAQSMDMVTASSATKGIESSQLSPQVKEQMLRQLEGHIILDPALTAEIILGVADVPARQVKLQQEITSCTTEISARQTVLEGITGEDQASAQQRAQMQHDIGQLQVALAKLKQQEAMLETLPASTEKLAEFVGTVYDGRLNLRDPQVFTRAIETGQTDELIQSILDSKKGTEKETSEWKEKLLKAAKYGGLAMVVIIAITMLTAGKEAR